MTNSTIILYYDMMELLILITIVSPFFSNKMLSKGFIIKDTNLHILQLFPGLVLQGLDLHIKTNIQFQSNTKIKG